MSKMKHCMFSVLGSVTLFAFNANADGWEANCQACRTTVNGDPATVQTAIETANRGSFGPGEYIDVYKKATASTGTVIYSIRHFQVINAPVRSSADLRDLGFERDADDGHQVPKPYGHYGSSFRFHMVWGTVIVDPLIPIP